MRWRSEAWFDHRSAETRFQHRSAMRAAGHSPESFEGKPMIGILNSWNDLISCNLPHKELVEYVKRGVLLEGGYPVELHTLSASSEFMKPSDLPYRNLMAMDVEESIRSMPLDGVVLLGECDKTIPAQLMGAVSCDLPALQLAAGHRSSGSFRGKEVNYGTDLWRYMEDYQAGLLDDRDLAELERCISCTQGGCPVMGTASTMKNISEMLGMMLPGTSSIPATHADRKRAAEDTGRRIVRMVKENRIPSQILTESAFHNAIKLVAATGGSTNAVIHLTAIAGRLGIRLDLDLYQTLTENIPLIVNVQPGGLHSMDSFYEAGGLGAVIKELLPLLDGTCLTAEWVPVEETYRDYASRNSDVISSLDRPFKSRSGLVVLRGNLAPNGAVLKRAASSSSLGVHRGPAIVFDDYEAMLAELENEQMEVEASSVLILRNCGPVGAGMPEWGSIPIPKKLLKQGVRDMVRISDARMSGTSYGTCILHVSPEAAVGGPITVVRTGDIIEMNVEEGRLTLLVAEEEIRRRLADWKPQPGPHVRGYMKLFADQVLQADEGCDLAFLRPKTREEAVMVQPIIGRG